MRRPAVIVSLTSFPERINMPDVLPIVLFSLLNQTLKPNKVILWLSSEAFPNKELDLPNYMRDYLKKGLSIGWTNDLHSFTKLIPALRTYPNDILITADDDMYYPRDWLERLYKTSLRHPGTAITACPLRIQGTTSEVLDYKHWRTSGFTPNSVLTFPRGVGGVLYPPGVFHNDICKTDLFLSICPTNDDIWFWAMVVLNDGTFNVSPNGYARLFDCIPYKAGSHHLRHQNKLVTGNDLFLKNMFLRYPQLLEKVFAEMENLNGIDMSERVIPGGSAESKVRHLLCLCHLFAYECAARFINERTRVLEVGFGDGYGCAYLAKKLPASDFHAIDLAPSLSAISSRKYPFGNCQFLAYDGRRIPFEDHFFDIILSFQVIEHVEDVEAYLLEMSRVLKPNGLILLSTPNRILRLADGQAPVNRFHLREYSAKQLESSLTKHFQEVNLYSIQANRSIMRTEHLRVGLGRTDLSRIRRYCLRLAILLERHCCSRRRDSWKTYTLDDFYFTDKQIDRGLDLCAIVSRPRKLVPSSH